MSIRNSALRIAMLYALTGILWVSLSDKMVVHLLAGNALLHFVNTAKGFLYVIITAILLYLLITKNNRRARTVEKKYRSYFADNPDPMWVFDLVSLRFLEVNDAAVAKYGFTRHEFLSMTLLDIRPEEEAEKLKETILDEREPLRVDNRIWTHRKKDGTLIYANITSHKVTGAESQMMVMAKDNTERIVYEKKLRAANDGLLLLNTDLHAQQKLISEVQRTAKLGGWEYYPATQKMICSDEIYYILDFAYPGEEDPLRNLTDHLHPEDVAAFKQHTGAMLERGESFQQTFRIINGRGQLKHLHMVAESEIKNNIPFRIKGSLQDVTESKEKDIQLQLALERYEMVAKVTNDMFYEYDLVSNTLTYSSDPQGIPNPAYLNETDPSKGWLGIVHPDDVQMMIETNQKSLLGQSNKYQCEYRVDFGGGNYRYVSDRAYIQYNGSQPTRMVGAIRDVDDLKQTTEENKRLGYVISRVHNKVMIVDRQRKIVWVNRAFEEVSGYTLGELKGGNPEDFIGGQNPDPVLGGEIRSRMAHQEVFSMELIMHTRKGEKRWVNADFTPLFNDKGEHTGYTTVYANISALKEKEASLIRQNETLRDIAWMESHEMRRPLSSILGLVELIRISTDEKEKTELFSLLDSCAKELDQMVIKISEKIQKGVAP